jgi:hypothetical protein
MVEETVSRTGLVLSKASVCLEMLAIAQNRLSNGSVESLCGANGIANQCGRSK